MTTRAAPDTLARWSAVLDPATLEAELRGLPADPWGWGVPRSVRVRVIKPHQRRCVFQATLETGGGARTLIGKAYARDRSDIANAMAAFVAAGVGLDDGCSIPLPYAHLPALGVRLEEYVTGPVAETVMLQGAPADRRAAARRCGRWLARFQRKAPRLAGKILDLSVDRERLHT